MRLPAPWVRIVAAAALSALLLVGMTISENVARATGQEIVVAMEAVDPRDALTGHYVQIDLHEQLAKDDRCPRSDRPRDPPNVRSDWMNAQGWVAFSRSGSRWTVSGHAMERGQAARLGPVVARGSFSCFVALGEETTNLRIELGVSRFHIRQSEAERIERLLRDQRDGSDRMFAILSIGTDGKARLKGIIVDGQRMMLDLY